MSDTQKVEVVETGTPVDAVIVDVQMGMGTAITARNALRFYVEWCDQCLERVQEGTQVWKTLITLREHCQKAVEAFSGSLGE